jgi:hypothetical protein
MDVLHFGRYVAVFAFAYLAISVLIWLLLVSSDTEPFTGSRRRRRTKLGWIGLLVVSAIAAFWPCLILYAFYRLFRTNVV